MVLVEVGQQHIHVERLLRTGRTTEQLSFVFSCDVSVKVGEVGGGAEQAVVLFTGNAKLID
jgi:hypothetical protein